jgi:hypothetical protein
LVHAVTKKLHRFMPLTFDRVTPEVLVDISLYATMPDGFHATNPSLLAFGDGFLVCVRGLNYVFHNNDMTKTVFTVGDRYRTVNRFFMVDRDFRLLHNLPALDGAFEDVEDIKLFRLGEQVMGVGSWGNPLDADSGARSIALLTIDPTLTGSSLQIIASPFGLRQEKNWAPFVSDGVLHFVYSFDPLIVLRYDFAARKTFFVPPHSGKADSKVLKFLIGGSSAGLPVAAGTLFAAHRRRVSLPSLDRTYVSRLYCLNKAGTVLTPGRYFSIGDASVQFINGLEREGDDFIISFGAMDRSAWLCRVPQDRLMPR